MSLIKQIAKQGLLASGMAASMLARRGRRGEVPVVMYHGVSAQGVTAEQMDAQFGFFARHFESRFFSELDAPSRRGATPIVLTFDDGMRNNFDLAVPLLRKHGLKATFFIVAGIFDGLEYLWNHRLSFQFYALPDALLPESCGGLPPDRDGLGLHSERWKTARQQVGRIKLMPHRDRVHLCEQVTGLFESQGAGYADWFDSEFRLAGAEQVRQRPECVEYGSHTRTHPILTSGLDDHELADEIEGSRARLREETGGEIDTFCFPNGDNDDRVRRAVARCYRRACTTVQGVHRDGDDPHRIPRVAAAGPTADMVGSLLRA